MSRRARLTTRRAFLKQISTTSFVAAACSQAACAATHIVQTALGPIDVSKLGFTLTHEHVCRSASNTHGDRESAIAKAVEKLTEARNAGVDTVIDVTTFDVGRDVRFGQVVSEKSGMQIVACTGQHMYAPDSFKERGQEEIAELFIRGIERGIDGTVDARHVRTITVDNPRRFFGR